MMSRRIRHLVLGTMLVVSTGCRQALSTVFDIPPPSRSAEAPAVPTQLAAVPIPEDTGPPPSIEGTLDPDSVLTMLPRDHAGNVDWVQAVRAQITRPRPTAPGRSPAGTDLRFGFDFLFPGPDTTYDAFFAHSVHTERLACAQCHPRIFPYRGTTITMGDVFQGKFCAECHGKVAFPVATGCERCHQRLSMPPDRAQPELLGTLVMGRVMDDSGTAAGLQVAALPPAVFPHWVHRIRYQCKACHMELFEPKLGANNITMRDIGEQRACGVCHNGETAFRASIGNCQRCHLPLDESGG